ncbi:MAG: type I 3-dehydroquinate dehydratase, partial [Phycisphaerae bacterium]
PLAHATLAESVMHPCAPGALLRYSPLFECSPYSTQVESRMTLLITPIMAENLEDLKTRAERAWAGGAEAVEVRIDTYPGDPAQLAEYLKTHGDRTWIVTCRSADEGGHFHGDAMERVSRLVAAARGTDAYVDFELADWRKSSEVRQKVRLASARADGTGHRLILSAHDFSGPPDNLGALVKEMADVGDAAEGKVAYRTRHICDTFDALDWMHERGRVFTVIAMGDDGLWTRVLAKKLGAFATYCALDDESATAPGQVTLDEMFNRYRWSAIDASTRVFGVIGDPVAHSMSPLLFNHWFADAELNAVYLPLRVSGKDDHIRRFLDGCCERPWLDIGGFSVTIPHKTSALRWAGDGADWMARRLGASNTLSFHDRGVKAYNTDCHAAVSSVADALGCSRVNLAGLSVDVLGAGGAARAALYGLPMFGCKVTVYGRSPQKTRRLADEYDAQAAVWDERVHRGGEVLINCTSVGMWPEVDASPMPANSLSGCRLVFDLIYNPLETQLLRDAAEAGCATLNGLDMFVRQAAMQFALWTGRSPDTQHARDMLRREIVSRADPKQ